MKYLICLFFTFSTSLLCYGTENKSDNETEIRTIVLKKLKEDLATERKKHSNLSDKYKDYLVDTPYGKRSVLSCDNKYADYIQSQNTIVSLYDQIKTIEGFNYGTENKSDNETEMMNIKNLEEKKRSDFSDLCPKSDGKLTVSLCDQIKITEMSSIELKNLKEDLATERENNLGLCLKYKVDFTTKNGMIFVPKKGRHDDFILSEKKLATLCKKIDYAEKTLESLNLLGHGN